MRVTSDLCLASTFGEAIVQLGLRDRPVKREILHSA
jgi:hypothetical protein